MLARALQAAYQVDRGSGSASTHAIAAARILPQSRLVEELELDIADISHCVWEEFSSGAGSPNVFPIFIQMRTSRSPKRLSH